MVGLNIMIKLLRPKGRVLLVLGGIMMGILYTSSVWTAENSRATALVNGDTITGLQASSISYHSNISHNFGPEQVIELRPVDQMQQLALSPGPGGNGGNGSDNGDNGNGQDNGDDQNNGGNNGDGSANGKSFVIKTYKDKACQQNADNDDQIKCLKLE